MLGHLEDLSVADIIQIVFLSRRTGVLEITDKLGRTSLMFVQGLLVNASSPDDPDLATSLRNAYLGEDAMPFIRMKEEQGVPAGTTALEQGLLSKQELEQAIVERVRAIVKPILSSREGNFNFVLADSLSPVKIEYEPSAIFPDGGLSPERIMATAGVKIKPLRGLEETVRAARALRRTQPGQPQPPPTTAPHKPMEAPAPEEAPFQAPPAPASETSLESLLPGPSDTEEVIDRKPGMQFRVGSASSQVSGPLAEKERRIVVMEPDPLIRVAIRRSFGKQGVTTQQFGTIEEAQATIQELTQKNRFFVTLLDAEPDPDKSLALLHSIKRTNRRLPVIVLHREGDPKTRHRFSDAGADVFAKKPSDEVVRSPQAQTELDRFSAQLFDLTQTAYGSWEQIIQSLGPEEERGAQFYEMSQREKVGRSFGLLKQLIAELSDPGNVDQIAQTILRLAGEYVDRGVLFAVDSDSFFPLGAFGETGDATSIAEQARRIRIARSQPSVLRDVAESTKPHRGKLRREAANEHLITTLGRIAPTEAVVLPVMNEDEVVGVLYGDNGQSRSPIGNTAGLEIFLSQAGFALQNALGRVHADE